MFEHSVRVPRSYKLAASILRKIKEEASSLKSLLYDNKIKHYRPNAIHALIVQALKHENDMNDLLVKSSILMKEPRLDPWLARILITELLWGKQKFPGQSKPEKTVLGYLNQFQSLTSSIENSNEKSGNEQENFPKPRYIRINTLLLTAADAVRYFQDEGYNLIRCTSKSYDDYLKQVRNLDEYDFMVDYHVKVVFVFSSNVQFHNCELYLEGKIFLQDKATCLAGFILSPTEGSNVLDLCAAPGMKTTHLAAIIKNKGTIYSVEQDTIRYQTLCDFIECSGATCVKAINGDAAIVDKHECPYIDYVLLDPSCSGSGICRADSNDAIYDLTSGRVKKLSAFQAKLLRHALNEFRTAKRVVYSTCSLYPEENESVIQDVIHNYRGKFKLVSAKEKLNNQWNNLGSFQYKDIGEKCIYARPESDYTSGFFVAVFEQSDEDKQAAIINMNQIMSLKTENSSEVTGNNDAHITDEKMDFQDISEAKDINLSNFIQDDNLICSDSNPIKSTKKRKKKELSISNETNTSFSEEKYKDCIVEKNDVETLKGCNGSDDEIAPQKNKSDKKKKLKNKDNLNYDTTNSNFDGDINDVISVEVKDINSINSIKDDNLIFSDSNPIKSTKKRKKKELSISNETNTSFSEDKYKDCIAEKNDVETLKGCNGSDDEIASQKIKSDKKRKLKNKDNLNYDTTNSNFYADINDVISVEVRDIKKKKHKKNKYLDLNEPEIIIIDENFLTETNDGINTENNVDKREIILEESKNEKNSKLLKRKISETVSENVLSSDFTIILDTNTHKNSKKKKKQISVCKEDSDINNHLSKKEKGSSNEDGICISAKKNMKKLKQIDPEITFEGQNESKSNDDSGVGTSEIKKLKKEKKIKKHKNLIPEDQKSNESVTNEPNIIFSEEIPSEIGNKVKKTKKEKHSSVDDQSEIFQKNDSQFSEVITENSDVGNVHSKKHKKPKTSITQDESNINLDDDIQTSIKKKKNKKEKKEGKERRNVELVEKEVNFKNID